MPAEPKLSRGVFVPDNLRRGTLTITYQIGNFRRTITQRCYVRGSVQSRGGKIFEIDFKGGDMAMMCPALEFRDAKNKIVSKTEYYWMIEVLECEPDDAPQQIRRAVADLALAK